MSTHKLIQAILMGDIEAATLAIENGADVNCRIIKTANGFELASEQQLNAILENNITPIAPVERSYYKVDRPGTTTLLNLLATLVAPKGDKSNCIPLSNLLMEHNADLSAFDCLTHWESWGNAASNYFQNTPLLNAIAFNNIAFATAYMAHLSKLELPKRQAILNYKDQFSAGFHTALEFAIRRGYCHLAVQIVRAGADTNPQPFIYSYGGKSPLHMACMIYGYAPRLTKGINSDLELIITLLEHNADYKKIADTEVFTNTSSSHRWTHVSLTPFDYLDVDVYGTNIEHGFNYLEACDAPAYSPKITGQIKHPFHEENCFILDNNVLIGRQMRLRKQHLNSTVYSNQDKHSIQAALLKRLFQDYQSTFPDSENQLNISSICTDNVAEIMETTMNSLSEEEADWFYRHAQWSGLAYSQSKPAHEPIQSTTSPMSEHRLTNKSPEPETLEQRSGMQSKMEEKNSFDQLKLFAAIFLDGELGGGPLEGLNLAKVADNIVLFLNKANDSGNYHLSLESIKTMQFHLAQISAIEQFQRTNDVHATAQLIFDTFEKEHTIYFPGGWTAMPAGHAMIYRLFQDQNGDVVFLSYNTGAGAQYHKTIASSHLQTIASEDYKEKFNPVYAIRFKKNAQLTQYGGLQAWIEKLVEPMVLPLHDHTYMDNNAEGIYEKIFAASAYLGGEVIDPTPYYTHITAGQRSGTCAQQATQKMLRGFFATDVDYERFILDYRLHVLQDALTTQYLPKSYQKEFHAALANTARMITTGKGLEQQLKLEDKQTFVDQLTAIKHQADAFFNAAPQQDEHLEPTAIVDARMRVNPLGWMPGDTPNQEHVRKKTPKTPLLLFDKAGSLIDALNNLDEESKQSDKRIFVHNIEQVCFTFCDKFQDFKDYPFEQGHTIEEWSHAITLLHKYSIEYFDFYFKNKKMGQFNFWFSKNEEDEEARERHVSVKDWCSASPRNQSMALGFMCLMHYAAIMYHARVLGYSEWNKELHQIDCYVAYMPGWLLFRKISRDFFLSSTDPDISHLFSNLKKYYSAQENMPIQPKRELGKSLLDHYKKIMDSSYCRDEKIALENFFKEHIQLIRSKNSDLTTKIEREITQHNIVALYAAEQLDNNSYLRNAIIELQGITISRPHLKALIKTQHQIDLCVYYCTNSLLFANTASYGETGFYIGQISAYSGQGFYIASCMTGDRSQSKLYGIPEQHDDSTWRHAMGFGPQELARIADGKGNQRRIGWDVLTPLMDDVYTPHLNSNQIRLLKRCTALDKDLRDLRTALPLQAMQIIDYFTRHMDLLEDRDYQFYMLLSLFQLSILDLAFDHQADVVGAMQQLCQKGVALGDMAQSAEHLTHRGLFLLKLTSWVYGYIATCTTASAMLKTTARIDHEKLDQDIQYWLAHDKRQSMQTELQRLTFYNIMTLYPPADLSLPENKVYLNRALYARFYMQQHSQDRIPGTITQAEDESFEPLILSMQNIDSKAIAEALPAVLEQLLPDQAPFISQDELADSAYYCLDQHKRLLCIQLTDGNIAFENQEFVHIPALVTRAHTAYERIIGVDASPLARKTNKQEYQFYWQGEEYYVSSSVLFKKINEEWYQYLTDGFLPEYLSDPRNYAWVNRAGDHALIMQHNPSRAATLMYHWQNGALMSHAPEGQVCFDGEARKKILACFATLEDINLIEIILLDPPEKQHYQFHLPRYQLSGHFNDETGVTLTYDNKTCYISSHPSPLATGMMISETKTSQPWQCLLLVPVQPFYTQETIRGSHYQLIHDIDRTTLRDKTLSPQSCAACHFDNMGKLETIASTEQLYLVYVYCARYEYDKAYALLKQYSFQGTPAELMYLHWLCEKLPAILDSQKGRIKPIVNTPLLAIQLTALAKFSHLQERPELKENLDEDLVKFLKELPDYIIKAYTRFHRLSNNLSDEARIPKPEIECLANYVWLRLESAKRTATKEKLCLEEEIDNTHPNDERKLKALLEQLQEQNKIIIKCKEQQTEGYLAYVYAKTDALPLEKEKLMPFVMPKTTLYGPTLITPYWPKSYQPLNHAYDVLLKSGITTMEPGKLYLECNYDNAITYCYIDSLGEEDSETLRDIGGIVLEEDKPLSMHTLNALKEPVLMHAAKRGHTPSIVGTLADLQQLLQEPSADEACRRACDLLALDMTDDVLFMHLKHYFRLINDSCAINDTFRATLKDFCQRTIMACADLNERLKNPFEKTSDDHRNDRLQIAIVLLRGLNNPVLFREAYAETIKQYSWNKNDLEKNSLWTIISSGNRGFCFKFDPHIEMPAISHIAPIVQKEVLMLKTMPNQASSKRHVARYHAQKPLSISEIPSQLVNITQQLQILSQKRIASTRDIIKQYKALSLTEQRTHYDETDITLDAMEEQYRDTIKSRIQACVDIQKSKDDVKHTLVRMTEDMVHHHAALKHYATLLPTDLQTLLTLKIKELGAKQLPLQMDSLLNKYAHGMNESFLDLRQLPKASRPLVRHALKQWLRNVFLYRQYHRILETLQQLSKPNTAYKQDELHLQLAKLILELHPLNGNAALELFQYQTNKTVRHDQWALIESLVQTQDLTTQNRVGQLIMGGGKSKVILPILAFLKADGYHMAIIETTTSLLQTTYQDLRSIVKDVFDQELEIFSFDRNTAADPVSLMHYLAKFRSIIQQKKCLIMAPSSLQSLHLKWRELLCQAQFDPANPELHEQIDVLSEILTLFSERADVIIDEIHKVLDINLELNYSIGQKTSLDPILIKTSLDLFEFLETVNIQVDESHPLAKLNGKLFLDLLTNPEVLNHPSALITHLMAYYAERYRAAHVFTDHPEHAKIQALLRAQWEVFLPLTLKQKLREQYGPSPDDDITIAIPYAANNVPTKNLFANFLESINYTTQKSRIEGIRFDVFKTVLQAWKKSDQEYLMCNNDGASEAATRYQTCLQWMMNQAELPAHLQGIDVANDEQLHMLYPWFQKNKPFIRYALEEAILPSIQLYRQKLTSNAINHANQVKRIQGLSGTPENYPTFDNRISFDVTTSFGTKNYLKTLLKKKNTPLLLQGTESLTRLSAIIDVGAHRRGQSNQEVAETIAEQLKDTPIRYVLFFQDDQLCAWKVGGLAQDIIVLPSTEPDKIKQCLQVKPELCFSYYDQSHATGIDLPQSPAACAAVSVDVTTTLSSFLQAVSRMRLLAAGQTINVYLSPALNDKLGENPTLDTLYQCLKNTEDNKLANDVFKAACKKLYNVVQMDLDKRLRALKACDSIRLFETFQHLLVDRNSDDIIELYGNEITERETHVILNQISDTVLKQWQMATSSRGINPDLRERCDAIIKDALIYCKLTQQTTLELGTEVNVEQQQEVQTELKTEVKTEIIDEALKPNVINTNWALHCALQNDGTLAGDEHTRGELPVLWRNHADNIKRYPTVEWSNDLSVSAQFYMTHDRHASGVLAKDCSFKPILSTLFWTHGETVRALLISQEEAVVLARRLASGDDFNNPACHVWLETTNGLALAGVRPCHLESNLSYVALKEQIYTLDGEIPLLAAKKNLIWFSSEHLRLLHDQMLQQGKTGYSTTFIQLEKRWGVDNKASVESEPCALASGFPLPEGRGEAEQEAPMTQVVSNVELIEEPLPSVPSLVIEPPASDVVIQMLVPGVVDISQTARCSQQPTTSNEDALVQEQPRIDTPPAPQEKHNILNYNGSTVANRQSELQKNGFIRAIQDIDKQIESLSLRRKQCDQHSVAYANLDAAMNLTTALRVKLNDHAYDYLTDVNKTRKTFVTECKADIAVLNQTTLTTRREKWGYGLKPVLDQLVRCLDALAHMTGFKFFKSKTTTETIVEAVDTTLNVISSNKPE